MRNRKLKTTLLSTAAMLAVAATVTSVRPVAAESLLAELAPVFNFVDQLVGDIQTPSPVNALKTQTPIKHLVVIFNENRSFDHYFGTYPKAMNPPGETPTFTAARNTPIPNNYESNPTLLNNNPNLNPANGASASNPFRFDRTQANTADQDHGYTPEQLAQDGGKSDLFPLDTGVATKGGAGVFATTAQVMGYFDGNTVTAFWNYAQNFAMSDNSWDDNFGPSTPGALNMFSGQTNGATFPVGVPAGAPPAAVGQLLAAADAGVLNSDGSFTLTGDIDPAGDVCSSPSVQVQMTGKNIGDLLNASNIPWGSFVGGFDLQTVNANGTTGCHRSTVGQLVSAGDYTPHHIWFQYYTSTANPTHARPLASPAAYGLTKAPGSTTADPANHAYDLLDFTAALNAGNFPAVSFIKMAAFQDGHPGNSDPLDEQTGLVNLINMLQQQPDWSSTAVIIAYDDSDGWYDHAFAASGSTAHASFAAIPVVPGVDVDALNGNGVCGTLGVTPVPNGLSGQPVNGRCGPGTRQPFVVISPYAKKNYISHVLISQASIPQFIEDNWLKSQRIGGGSFDATTGSIMDMFDFDQIVTEGNARKLKLDPIMGTVIN